MNRQIAPLVKTADSIEIDSTSLAQEQVADLILTHIKEIDGKSVYPVNTAVARLQDKEIQAVAKNDFVSESPYQSEFEEIGFVSS